jgi:hypothetical protein
MAETLHDNAVEALKKMGYAHCVSPGPDIYVDIERSGCTDAVLPHLKDLSTIHHLNLSRTQVTDRIMEILQAHPEIRELDITDTKVGDEGLRFLPLAKSLEVLGLGSIEPPYESKITDAGIVHVAGLKALKHLDLFATAVTADGLKVVGELPSLECLGMSAKQVSEDSIASLQRAPKLRKIILIGAEDTDPVFIHLQKSLPNVAVVF